MPNTSIQDNPLIPLHPSLERIIQPNCMMKEYIHEGHLKGVWDDPNVMPPFPGNVPNIINQRTK